MGGAVAQGKNISLLISCRSCGRARFGGGGFARRRASCRRIARGGGAASPPLGRLRAHPVGKGFHLISTQIKQE
jgi:hypothetical protein